MQNLLKKSMLVILILTCWILLFKFGPVDELSHHIQTIYREIFKVQIAPRQDEFESPKLEILQNERHDSCDNEMPAHGSNFKLSANSNGSKLKSRVQLTNEHLYPALITFTEIGEQQAYAGVFIHPNQSTQLSLPVGQYTINLATGEVWCNTKQGFKNGAVISPEQILSINQNQVANIRLLSFGAYAEDVMVSLSNSLGLVAMSSGQAVEGQGSLILQRVVGGHYAVEGTINQLPVHFLVDTGATAVAVSENFAKHAGIKECIKAKSRTANGLTDICIAIASELTIEQFRLKNVEINYGKGMSDDTFLLGMNVIGLFKMEQQGDVMRLSRQ
jgi:clan AA aspartic protease (TIGR02281 family)